MKKNHFLFMSLLIALLACGDSREEFSNHHIHPDSLSWISGSWQGTAGEGIFTESWERISDSLYSGNAFVISGNDTLAKETITLEFMEGEVYYIPTIGNQNKGQPVRFRLTSFRNRMLIFENPEHDFPQMISYTLSGSDSLIAVISGNDNGNPRTERFAMKKQLDKTE